MVQVRNVLACMYSRTEESTAGRVGRRDAKVAALDGNTNPVLQWDGRRW
jgi:hypothetical protein